MRLVYLNLKCQKIDEDNPDNWQNIESLGLSMAATYSVTTKKEVVYLEKDVDRLIRLLLKSDLVVTFNGINFDYRILNNYTDNNLLLETKVFSILDNVEGDLWQRLSLANLARQNLDRYQTISVKNQIMYYQRNMMRILKDAITYDLNSIIKLFQMGCKRKFLNYWCPDDWTQKSFRTDSWARTCQKLTFVAKNYRR